MGGDAVFGASKCSMWKQVFGVVIVNIAAYRFDQENESGTLVSPRFYTNKLAKSMPPASMKLFLEEVKLVLCGVGNVKLELQLVATCVVCWFHTACEIRDTERFYLCYVVVSHGV
jgi:hypothetical protein